MPETTDQLSAPRYPSDADAALKQTVIDVLAGPVLTDAKPSHEVLHYATTLTDPRARITANPARKLNVVGAVARFVWMVAASDRLEDIAYYEPKVRPFTDNEISVPGSSYGRRLFEPSPGLNQVQGVVDRLRADPASRRAAAVVWSPADAVRPSKDIPCTFGMFFHIRDNELIASTVMRSNNAYLLLPFNIFEFSVLAEAVAAAASVPLGRYVHWAASMHVYTDWQLDAARQVAAGGDHPSPQMPAIPADDPLEQIRRLAVAEARLRHASNPTEFEAARLEPDLNEYWAAYLNVLAAWGAHKRGWDEAAQQLATDLPDHFRAAVLDKLAAEPVTANPVTPARPGTGDSSSNGTAPAPTVNGVHAATTAAPMGGFGGDEALFDEPSLTLDLPQLGELPSLDADSPEVIAMFEPRLLEFTRRTKTTVPFDAVPELRRIIFNEDRLSAFAARDGATYATMLEELADDDAIADALRRATRDVEADAGDTGTGTGTGTGTE